MRTQRIEIRASAALRKKLDELANDQGIPASVLIRRLVLNAHKERFGEPGAVQPPATAFHTSLPLPRVKHDEASAAASIQPPDDRTFAEMMSDGEPCTDGDELADNDVFMSVGLDLRLDPPSVQASPIDVRISPLRSAVPLEREVTADDVLNEVEVALRGV